MRRLLLLLSLCLSAAAFAASASAATPVANVSQTGCVGDQDCDGTPDGSDACPTVGGAPSNGGCPMTDTDSDGIPDGSDGCPTAAGPPSNGGCPVTDSDGDGVADGQDGCPTVSGPASNAGCPAAAPAPADSDGDTRPDSEDACPTEAGMTPSGCPDRDGDQVVDKNDPCPDVRGDASYGGANDPAIPGGCPDADHDGVTDAKDKCEGGNYRSVDAKGCEPFSARGILFAKDLDEMRDNPDLHGQCNNSAGDSCTVRITVTLSAASARSLGIARGIVDKKFKLDRSAYKGARYAIPKNALSAKLVRAFKQAYARNLAITMTLSGSYVRGSDDPVKFPKSTFTLKRKPPARSEEPSVTNGDKGPSTTGITRRSNPDDY